MMLRLLTPRSASWPGFRAVSAAKRQRRISRPGGFRVQPLRTRKARAGLHGHLWAPLAPGDPLTEEVPLDTPLPPRPRRGSWGMGSRFSGPSFAAGETEAQPAVSLWVHAGARREDLARPTPPRRFGLRIESWARLPSEGLCGVLWWCPTHHSEPHLARPLDSGPGLFSRSGLEGQPARQFWAKRWLRMESCQGLRVGVRVALLSRGRKSSTSTALRDLPVLQGALSLAWDRQEGGVVLGPLLGSTL